MHLKSIAAAAAIMASSFANAVVAVPMTTLNAGAYSVVYDATTTSFGAISNWTSVGNTVSFEWSVASSVNVSSFGGGTTTATFALPSFSILANAGYTLGGPVVASLGNITYFQNGTGASTAMTATGSVSVNGGAAVTLPSSALAQTVVTPSFGYFVDAASVSTGGFTSFAVNGASITLTASSSAAAGSFASIGAQPQNKLKFEFTAAPVPEPESYALLLAGLGAIGLVVRRRQQR